MDFTSCTRNYNYSLYNFTIYKQEYCLRLLDCSELLVVNLVVMYVIEALASNGRLFCFGYSGF
jgi:hypothetical protein